MNITFLMLGEFDWIKFLRNKIGLKKGILMCIMYVDFKEKSKIKEFFDFL